MRSLRTILLILVTAIIGTVISCQGQAARFPQPRNQVYQVTYINAGAYQTKRQYAIFNARGHVVYVDVEDIDAHGNPVVDSQATVIQRQASRRIHRYLTDRRALNQAASGSGFVVQPGQRVRIQNRLITRPTTGRIKVGAAGEFTVTLATKAKYQTIQFKPAPVKYQFKK